MADMNNANNLSFVEETPLDENTVVKDSKTKERSLMSEIKKNVKVVATTLVLTSSTIFSANAQSGDVAKVDSHSGIANVMQSGEGGEKKEESAEAPDVVQGITLSPEEKQKYVERLKKRQAMPELYTDLQNFETKFVKVLISGREKEVKAIQDKNKELLARNNAVDDEIIAKNQALWDRKWQNDKQIADGIALKSSLPQADIDVINKMISEWHGRDTDDLMQDLVNSDNQLVRDLAERLHGLARDHIAYLNNIVSKSQSIGMSNHK